MENLRLAKKLRSGRVEVEISLGQSRGGTWYYNTRIFRPFRDPRTGEAKKGYTFGQDDVAHVVDIARRAGAWIDGQLANQETRDKPARRSEITWQPHGYARTRLDLNSAGSLVRIADTVLQSAAFQLALAGTRPPLCGEWNPFEMPAAGSHGRGHLANDPCQSWCRVFTELPRCVVHQGPRSP